MRIGERNGLKKRKKLWKEHIKKNSNLTLPHLVTSLGCLSRVFTCFSPSSPLMPQPHMLPSIPQTKQLPMPPTAVDAVTNNAAVDIPAAYSTNEDAAPLSQPQSSLPPPPSKPPPYISPLFFPSFCLPIPSFTPSLFSLFRK